MTWGAVGGAVIGGVIAGQGARSAARTQSAAADRQSQAQLEAAQLQADLAREAAARQEEASRFRPVGVSSRFGQAQYTVGPEGYLTQAGYSLDPQLASQRDQLLGMLPGSLSQALSIGDEYGQLGQQYFGMGQEALGAINLDPMQAAAERTRRLQELEAPGRALAQERLFSGLASKGLTGLATDVGMGGAVNPYALAQEQGFARQDALTAAESYDRARSDIASDLQRASGLFTTGRGMETYQSGRLGQALSPYQSLLAQAQGLEGLGATALQAGLDISEQQRQAALTGAGAAARGMLGAGKALGSGMTQAAATQAQAANLRARQQAALYGGIGQSVSNMDLSGLFNRTASSFPLTSAAGQYANNFNYTLPPAQSTQTAFAVPNYAPRSFAPTSTGSSSSRMFGAGSNQPLFISP
jgi:hypothetical protein